MGIIIEKTAIVMLWRCIFDLTDISGVSIFKHTKCTQIYYFTVVTKNFLQLNQPARNISFLHQRPYTAAIKHKFFDIDRKD